MVSSFVTVLALMLAFICGPPPVCGGHHKPVCFSLGGPILLLLGHGALHQAEIAPQ
jgi:hypothetical protein